jgi:hypothetical protein
MDPRAKMLLGLVLVLIGAFVTWVTYSAAAPGGRYVAFYGVIVLGAGLLLFGVVQYITADGSGGVDGALPGKTPEYKLLLRAMIAASELDGPLDQDKIYIIRDMALKDYQRRTLRHDDQGCFGRHGEGGNQDERLHGAGAVRFFR